MNQKVKLLPFRFTPIYIPGKLHVVTDTWSRRSDSTVPSVPKPSAHDMINISNVGSEYSSSLAPPSWVSGPASVASLLTAPDLDHCIQATLNEEAGQVEEAEASLAGAATMAVRDMSTNYILVAQAPVRVITWERLQDEAAKSPIWVCF
jgi:hypothetical protein